MQKTIDHINYALVEETRPPLYTAMKYWGKKPHNIWSKFVENYSEQANWVLDPFAGSGISAFEAAKLGRKAIAFDLNPLTGFMIESLTSSFDEDSFLLEYSKIEKEINNDPIYKTHFIKLIGTKEAGVIFNFKWTDNKVESVAYKIGKTSYVSAPSEIEKKNSRDQKNISIPYWYPTDKFPNNPSINYKFIKDIGGDTFENLWTTRTLFVLSKIFDCISKVNNKNIQLQLLSGFIQTLHLCCKMVVPRNAESKRDFSGSWGRADYMIRRRSMEQNPLIVFHRSCIEKQSILYSLRDFKKQFPKGLKINDVKKTKKLSKTADINYGTIDVADIGKYIPEKSVDFVITDPPYAGLVYYLDLSMIWLVWLKKYDSKYTPDLRSEITIKRGSIDRNEYTRRLENAFKEIHKVLKEDSYLIVTFHHQKIIEWNTFVKCVKFAGFKFDKVTHQYNRRSGESNVANPYGTSGADFYIRCTKHRLVDFSNDASGLEHFIVHKSIEVIALRNQPTPYTILVIGLIPEMLQAGFFQPEQYKSEIERILDKNTGPGKIFKSFHNGENKAGNYWWFDNPTKYINYPDLPLNRRIEETVISYLRRNIAAKFDDILSEIFRNFPNGLTPDPRGVVNVLQKYAYKSSDRWKIKEETEKITAKHTATISLITTLGRNLKNQVFIGKREQPEKLEDGKRLSDIADLLDLKFLAPELNQEKIRRIEMIDCIWFSGKKQNITSIFEVENSTDFTAAIQRGSNLSKEIPKFMIIPDSREKELMRISDPYFLEGFDSNNWRYLTFQDLGRLVGYSKLSLVDLLENSKAIQR